MKLFIIYFILCLSSFCWADTPPPQNINVKSDNLTTVSGSNITLGQKTMANSLPIVVSSDQSAIPVSQSGTWTTGRTWSLLNTTDSIAVSELGSWTVTANSGTNLNTSALALDTSVNGLLVSQGSTTVGQKGPLALGSVNSTSPSYTTAQTSPLSLTTLGALRTDSSATLQPVTQSGTWSVGRTWTLLNTTDSVNSVQSGTWTVQQGATPTTVANAWPIKLTDGVDTAGVAAASTAPVSTDPALVVALSPNNTTNMGTKIPLAANSPSVATVGVASGALVAANASRKGLVIHNNSANIIYLAFGVSAVIGSGIELLPGGDFWMDEYSYSQAAVNAIATAASSSAPYQEFQ